MSATRWHLVAALVLASAAAAAVDRALAAERKLTLDEAVRLAVQKNEAIQIERQSVTAANAAVRGAKGAYDPVLGLDWGWSRSTEPLNAAPADPLAPQVESSGAGAEIRQLLPTGGALRFTGRGARETIAAPFALLSPAYTTRVGVELRQPLLRGLAIDGARLSSRVARAGRQGASASLHRAVSETIAATEQAYWALAAARLAVDVREEAVRLAETQFEQTRSRVESGTVPETELAQPRAELERRRGELLAAREALARSQNTLKLLILGDADGSTWLEDLVPGDSVQMAVAPVVVEAALARGLEARPELTLARAVVERRRAELAFARSGVLPGLNAVASYERIGLAGAQNPLGLGGALPAGLSGGYGRSFDRLGDGDFDSARLALVLDLPLPNRSARAAATIARSVERQADLDLMRVRKAIRAEILDAAAALETAGQRIEAARAGREAAQVQLDAEVDRYTTGLSTNFLVLTRQNDLSRSRLDEISALTDYRKARSEMARATGSLIDERSIGLNGIEH
jgi:outer membrane protein